MALRSPRPLRPLRSFWVLRPVEDVTGPRPTQIAACWVVLESRLRGAIAQSQFVLHYQPQIDLRTRVIRGAEALLRWQTPDRGLVSPAELLRSAE